MEKKSASTTLGRSSNIELFRILVMLFIVFHHYVVSSDISLPSGPIYSDIASFKSIVYLLIAGFGKTGINCFVFITGYFMCKSNLTVKKYITLLFEVMFYNIVISVLFLALGETTFSASWLIKTLLPITEVGTNFTGTYLLFLLFIPFLNILIKNLTEKQHLLLIALTLFVYCFFGTVKILPVKMNYVSWFIVLYIVISYIRMYPRKLFEKTKLWGLLSLLFVGISCLSILLCIFLSEKLGRNSPHALVSDSNTLLALLTALCLFLFFKNVTIKQSKAINTISSFTFGVFLIHANGNGLRGWLWNDFLKNADYYTSSYWWLHLLLSVFAVFVVCCLIDFTRKALVEKPFLRFWDKKYPKLLEKYKKAEEALCKRFQIQ